MRVKFYRNKSRSHDVIRAMFPSNSKACFSATEKEIKGMKIFKNASCKTMDILLEQNPETIHNIAKEHAAEIILTCSDVFLKKVIRATDKHEIDVSVFITESRELLHYMFINIETDDRKGIVTLMLVSYSE